MSFLAPLFLVGALAGTIPIVLHLLKREPDARVRFSAVRFLRSAPVEHASRRHLRELLLLALRVSALLLLALAFARPFLVSGRAVSAGITVVALDTSLSLGAPGQFDKARQLARQAIDNASGLVAVVTFDDVARVASEPSGDRALATAAVVDARPGSGGTSYRAAIDVSADLLRGQTGTIVVVTDLQAAGWDTGGRPSVPESARVVIADVGAPPSNLAVTAARIVGDRVVASVRNAGSVAREARVTLNVTAGSDGASSTTKAADVTVSVGSGQTQDVEFVAPRGRSAAVTVDDPQGAVEDNARYIVLDNASVPSVLVVTATGDLSREGFYVAQALGASGVEGGAYAVEGVAGAGLQTWDQPRLNAHTAVVLLSTRGLEHRGRSLLDAYARSGGGVLIAAGAEIEGDVVSEALGDAKVVIVAPIESGGVRTDTRTLAPSDLRHPVLQAFAGRSSLGLVTFKRATTIQAGPCQTLARFSTGEAALVDCQEGGGRALVLASDLDNQWNDFPLHASFVPFIHEAMKYLAGTRKSSDYLVAQAPAGTPRVPGVFPLASATGGPPRLVAVNVDPIESDATRVTAQEFQAAVGHLQGPEDSRGGLGRQGGQGGQDEERQHVWQYVLGLMMAVLIVESALATRTA